jgi:signal transduction histidine kinase
MFSSIRTADNRTRLLVFGLAAAAGLALVFWLERSTWKQAGALQAELAAVRTESFYLGVHLRAGIWRLDGRLLRFQLSEDANEREGFVRESRELSELIGRTKPHLVTPQETTRLAEVESAYKAYLTETTPLLERGIRGIRRGTTEQLARTIAEKSAATLRHCDALIEAHRVAWESVLTRSDHSVSGVVHLMQLSAGLLLVLSILLLILAYRAFVTPLRNRLDANAALLQRQEKLASLGALAAGVAHEIRNPLAAIKFRLFSLKDSLASGAADAEDLQIIGDEINRLERIVQDFLKFARPSEPELARVSAGLLLQEVHDLLSDQLEKLSVRLVVEPAADVWLRADKEQLKQVLINLAQNAAESVRANGTVTLRAHQGVARLNAESQPVAILEVADTGPGIPLEVESRLFDPFFSTKQGGTGLGLPIAARIIEKHGGSIQYQTQRNRGTTFSVALPRWNDHARKDSAH